MARGGSRPGAGRPSTGASHYPQAAAPPLAPHVMGTNASLNVADKMVTHASADQKMNVPVPERYARKYKSMVDFALAVVNGEIDGATLDQKIRMATAALAFTDAKIGEKAPGKKEQRSDAAATAGQDSEWGDDLTPSVRPSLRAVG